VPGGQTFNAIAIANDGSAAGFDVYTGADWAAMDKTPLARLTLRR